MADVSLPRGTPLPKWVTVFLLAALVVGVSLGLTRLTVLYLAQSQPLRLEPNELHRLVLLRDTTMPRLLSAVSPDDTTIVMGSLPEMGRAASEPGTPQLAFLNIESGISTPVDPVVLTALPESEIAWRDANTAVYLSVTSAGDPLLVTLDRASGAVLTSTLRLPGRPLSLAPNASRLLIEISGSTGATLAAVELASGEVVSLVQHNGGPTDIAWSLDGSRLALVRTEVPAFLATDTSAAISLAMQDGLGELPPAENPFFQGNLVDIFDFARHDFRPAALRARDGTGDLFLRVHWSPDGSILMAQMARPGQVAGRANPIYRYPDRSYLRFYTAELQLLGTLDRAEIEAASTARATFVAPNEVVIAAPAGATFRLHHYHLGTDEFRTLPTPAGSFADAPRGYQIEATHQSRQLVFNHSSFLQPPELYRMGLDGTGLQPLTHLNETAATTNQIRVDEVTVPLADGRTRTGYLLQPASASFPPRNVPLVLYQQGGPGGAMTNRWGATAEEPFNLLPNFGIAVLFMPLPGREGFGPAFLTELVAERNFGQVDVDEAAQIVEALIRQGYTSQDRVGLTGCSYGGYFTSQSIVRHPDLYAAASAQCTMLDLPHMWEFVARPEVTYWVGRVPSADEAEYRADSPSTGASGIRTPLLLIHGAEDMVPVSVVASFRDQIAATGTPVELLTFQGEGHGLTQPSHQMAAAQAQIRWFQQYLAREAP